MYWVYILAGRGVGLMGWFETYADITAAIEREKELKTWRREWKINLIERDNQNWDDLYGSITR